MAHFYGTVQGQSRRAASRLGSARSGLMVTAQSWQGSVTVELHAGGADGVTIMVGEGSTVGGRELFVGSLKELLAWRPQAPVQEVCHGEDEA